MRILISILLFFCVFNLKSQITFEKAIDVNGGYECPISVINEPFGYRLFAMCSDFQDFQGWRACKIVDCDFDGNIISTRVFGKLGTHYYGSTNGSFIKTSDSNYVVAVTEYDTSKAHYDACIIKFDASGDTLFVKCFGGNKKEVGYTVVEASDGGYVMVGESESFGNQNQSKFYCVKVDSIGNTVWEKIYPQTENGRGVKIVNYNNGFLLGGWVENGANKKDAFVIHIDSMGNEVWTRIYGDTMPNCGAELAVLPNGDFVFHSCRDTIINTQSKSSYFITKSDSSGLSYWKSFVPTDDRLYLISIRFLSDREHLIVCGWTYDPLWNNRIVGYIAKLDTSGNFIWERRYSRKRILTGNIATTELHDFLETDDGGLILLGKTFEADQDLWLVKLDSNGCMGNYCGLTDPNCYYLPYPDCITSINEYDEEDLKVSVYPNPATNEITISKAVTITEPIIVKIYDVYGREQKVITAIATETIADISSISSGTYLYEIITTQGKVYQGRLIVIK
jgi:hypothetical protein